MPGQPIEQCKVLKEGVAKADTAKLIYPSNGKPSNYKIIKNGLL